MQNNQNDPKRKVYRVRFNFSWLYLILVMGIGWLLLNNSGANPQKVEWAEVKEMFQAGDIKEITYVRNNFKGDITVRPDRIAKYADKFGGKVPKEIMTSSTISAKIPMRCRTSFPTNAINAG